MKQILAFLILISSLAGAQNHHLFENEISGYANKLHLPGLIVGVAKGDSLIFSYSAGTVSPKDKRKIGPEDIIGIASLTKTFSAVALQLAVGEGRLHWEDTIEKFPNEYFNSNRWNEKTTIAHCFSHTSESNPIGTNFVYNGSKFNLPFNVFQTLNNVSTKNDISRKFSYEIDTKILVPLGLASTISHYDSIQIEKVGDRVVQPWNFDAETGKYTRSDFDIRSMNSGPAFGMMSTVNDLVKYSYVLDQNQLLTQKEFKLLTRPFYNGSPYGLGWFSYDYDGQTIPWVYGWGNNDAAILLKIPLSQLTFVLLTPANMPSFTTRLQYGDPFNSLPVIYFFKSFVLNISEKEGLDFTKGIKSLEQQVLKLNKKYRTDIFTKELYAMASLGILTPKSLNPDTFTAEEQLALYLNLVGTKIDVIDPLIFELLSFTSLEGLTPFKRTLVDKYRKSNYFHPSTAFFCAKIMEQMGKEAEAITLYRTLADDDFYKENEHKFEAMVWLAKHYRKSDLELSKSYLQRLITYKENISEFDDVYQEAKKMLLLLGE